uniref:Uncharacterized protein n=1 Tax=Onchocerca volvulus TaxID=6282 RepID=A0A8R1XZI7_ONCVO
MSPFGWIHMNESLIILSGRTIDKKKNDDISSVRLFMSIQSTGNLKERAKENQSRCIKEEKVITINKLSSDDYSENDLATPENFFEYSLWNQLIILMHQLNETNNMEVFDGMLLIAIFINFIG